MFELTEAVRIAWTFKIVSYLLFGDPNRSADAIGRQLSAVDQLVYQPFADLQSFGYLSYSHHF